MARPAVLLTVDCLRADHVGCYGYDRPTTPNIDAFAAQDDVTIYRHSYANCPGTRWAFQSIHAGVYMAEIAGAGIPNDGVTTIAESLRAEGYQTGGFGKNGFLSREYRYDTGFGAFVDAVALSDGSDGSILKSAGQKVDSLFGSETFRDRVLVPIFRRLQHTTAQGEYTPSNPGGEVAAHAVEWIHEQQRSEQPYFAWFHSMDAHTPYGRWEAHLEAIGADPSIPHTIHPGDEGLVTEGEPPRQAAIDAYDAGIRSADAALGHILDTIDEEAIVVITGDHGEEFGQYGQFHEGSLYSSMTQVPMIVRHPELPGGHVSDTWVQHLDIPPTVVESVGGEGPENWRGENLVTVSRNLSDPLLLNLTGDRTGLREGEWKLLNSPDEVELYNTPHSGDDSEEVSDSYPDKVAELQQKLSRYMDRITQVRYDGIGGDSLEEQERLSDDVKENLSELGYIE